MIASMAQRVPVRTVSFLLVVDTVMPLRFLQLELTKPLFNVLGENEDAQKR